MTVTLEALHGFLRAHHAKGGLPHGMLPGLETDHFGTPHVLLEGETYAIEIWERGSRQKRIEGLTLEDAGHYFLLGSVTGHFLKEELKARKAPVPPRRLPNGLVDDGYSRWNWIAPTLAMMARMSGAAGRYAARHYAHLELEPHERRNARWPLPADPRTRP